MTSFALSSQELRDRLESSPVMDAERFAHTNPR
jgi:hypothetical protein